MKVSPIKLISIIVNVDIKPITYTILNIFHLVSLLYMCGVEIFLSLIYEDLVF